MKFDNKKTVLKGGKNMANDTDIRTYGDMDLSEAEALITMNVVKMQQRLAPSFDGIKNASGRLIESVRVGQLDDASGILEKMSGKLVELKSDDGFLAKIFFGSKKIIQRKILNRKAIKTALEEMFIDYSRTRDRLMENIENIEELKRGAQKALKSLDEQIASLQIEKTVVLDALVFWEDSGDKEKVTEARTAITRYDRMIAEAEGMKFLHATTLVEIASQLQQRETLYTSMVVFGPQLQVLLGQQLAQLVSQLEVRLALKKVEAMKEGIRQIAVVNAKTAREDAIAVAKVAHEATVDETTILRVTDEVLGMIQGVKSAIIDAKAANERAITAAKTSIARIQSSLVEK